MNPRLAVELLILLAVVVVFLIAWYVGRRLKRESEALLAPPEVKALREHQREFDDIMTWHERQLEHEREREKIRRKGPDAK